MQLKSGGKEQAKEVPTRTCGHVVVDTLLAHDLKTLYCLPGVQNDSLFNAIHDAGGALRPVHTRHEQGAAYMALGAALATGRPAAYSAVPGPGILNTTAALATANSTNAPVLALSGQIRSDAIGKGYGLLHEIPDQMGILERLTKRAARVMDPGQAAAMLAAAIADVKAARPGPVALELPQDVLAARGDFITAEPLQLGPTASPDAGAIADAARAIAKASRPLIVVASGALDASAELLTFAEQTGIPVNAYRTGRGAFDERHPLSLPYHAAYRYWRECDVVIGIGARLQSQVQLWGTDSNMTFIRIDIDPRQLGLVRKADIGIVGDAATVLPLLSAELSRLSPLNDTGRAAFIARIKGGARAAIAFLKPQLEFLEAIRDAVGEDGILVDELTQVGYVARFAYPVYHPRTYICAGYQGTLGWGYATALGVQDANPDKRVVSINGDGGFLFTMPEMATAMRHDIPLVAVVFNDGAYGNVRRMQEELYGNRVIATDLTNPDFVKLAESFGMAGYRVRQPAQLRQTLVAALDRREPALIEVPVGPMPDPFRVLAAPRIRGI